MTEVALFTPANGLESMRSIVVRTLAAADYGDLVPYSELEALLDRDRRGVQNAVGAAKPVLEREHCKAAVPVANKGYRIAQPGEHMGLAVGHQSRSRRSLRRALSAVENVNHSLLTEGERAAVQLGVVNLSLVIEFQRRNDLRAARHERMIEATGTQVARSAAEIEMLKARLAQLEAGTAE